MSWEVKATELWEVIEKVKYYEALESKLKEELKVLSNNEEHAEGKFRLFKVMRKGSINTKKIAEDYRIDVENYRGADIVSWYFKNDNIDLNKGI